MLKPVLFFDTETTGKYDFKRDWDDPTQPYLVQLAAIVATRDRVMASFNVIVKPEGWSIPDDAAKIHGIDVVTAIHYGILLPTVLAMFNQLTLVSTRLVAHNLDFDLPVMLCQYHRAGKQHRMGTLDRICTMKAATSVLKLPKPAGWKPKRGDEYKWPTLTEVHNHFFGTGFDGAHDAMVDVTALARCYWALVDCGAIDE